MIEGIKIKDLQKHVDERGFFVELMREDWKELFLYDKIPQLNISYCHPGITRAWHRHIQGQVDYFICIEGSIKVCAYDDRKNSKTYRELDEIILNSGQLRVVRIPGILWHGYRAMDAKPALTIYAVSRLYDYRNPDDERRPWNDPMIIPQSINGKTDDKRVGKPWDWNHPHNV